MTARSRSERRAAGLCPHCGEVPRPGRSYCSECAAKHRARNRAYEQRRRDEGRVMPRSIVQATQEARWACEDRCLIAFAELHGRVPTLPEVATLIACPHPTSSRVQQVRLRAFGLRPKQRAESRAQIPYPIPASWTQVSA